MQRLTDLLLRAFALLIGMSKRGAIGDLVRPSARFRLAYANQLPSSRRYYVRRAGYARYKRKSLFRLGGRMPADSGELKDVTNNFTAANCFSLASVTGQINLMNGMA